jgi:hypothetical protein
MRLSGYFLFPILFSTLALNSAVAADRVVIGEEFSNVL